MVFARESPVEDSQKVVLTFEVEVALEIDAHIAVTPMNHSFRGLQPSLGNDLDFRILRPFLFGGLLWFSLEAREHACGKSQGCRSQQPSMQAFPHRSKVSYSHFPA